ncbi:MAG: LysM peptidoglycan-binding domain-containing protein [Candidatus Staskawiczbacteria bacterium]
MLKIFNKALIRAKNLNFWGLFKNPLFYFAVIAIFLFGSMCTSCDSANNANGLNNSRVAFNSFLNVQGSSGGDSLFSSQTNAIPLETPDLKIIEDNAVYGISTPQIVSGKVLGDAFGGNNQNQKEVADYTVQPGDTLQSIADSYNISVNTLIWANDMTSSSTIKVGQDLTILPTDGVLHVVKSGDTVSAIAQTYKAKSDDIIAFNGLANQDDVYIGDILIVPGGIMPRTAAPLMSNQVPLADDFFIFPTQGKITQGLHYFNAVDTANKCGTPIYAAAAGVVQRAVSNGGWNGGMGNHITILHSNGTVTYYGHLMTLLVKSGDKVYTGQNIALMGGAPGMAGAGDSTGCHLHFEVVGARNPLAKYPVGTYISYKQ